MTASKQIGSFLTIFLFSAMAISLFPEAYAKVFVIQNSSVDQFVVNGSSGNIVLAPNFGNVGIWTIGPQNKLEVAGTFNATSSSTQMLLNSNGDVFINLKG